MGAAVRGKDIVIRALLSGAVLALAACDAGPSAVVHDGDGASPAPVQKEKPPVWASGAASSSTASDDVAEASMPIPGQADAPPSPITDMQQRDLEAAKAYPPLPVPLGPRATITDLAYGDWPLWSKNRKYSQDNNAHYQFDHHGAEIGARTYEDYLAVVHGFIHNPPPGTETLKRHNGDTLLYNTRLNVFAVMTKQGAPRTLFRPYDGAAYWDKQKQIEAQRASLAGGYGDDGG